MRKRVTPSRGLPVEADRPIAERTGRGWRVYLALAAVLAPLCVPAGPGQSALLDIVNLVALAVFFVVTMAGHKLRVPLAVPMLIIGAGSLLATLGAPSVKLVALSMSQDVYLFAWFVVLVNVLRTERDLRLVRVAWMWAAAAVAVVALTQLLLRYGTLATLLGSRGLRPPATLYNPNMLADYMVISMFITISLTGLVRKRVLLPVMALLALGLLSTKSNGGMISFAAGAFIWVCVRAYTSRIPVRTLAAVALLSVGMLGLGVWLNKEWGFGNGLLASLQEHTFAGRMEHSGASRMRIWDQLERSYARSPLGIGPGNSGALTLTIAERERPDSYRSKEAHSDYLAYAIERGPLGIIGLLSLTVVMFVQVGTYWRHRPHRGAGRRRYSRWTAGMAAALAASAVHSTVIEKLHFRHFWLLAAIVVASAMVAAQRAARRPVVQETQAQPVTLRPALTSGPRGRLLARGMAS